MASELCMNCFSVKGKYEVCPFCGYIEGTSPKQPHHLIPGTILKNQFIVGTSIGVGGFGIIYKCFDTTLGVIVAVKEFYPVGLVNRSPGEKQVGILSGGKRTEYANQLKRFLLEAQSVALFGKAKDIVNVYDYFEENGTAYIVMEYIDGVLLKDYLEKQGAMNPETAMSVIMPIIHAVKKIHSKGIVHRDISPDNIFIANEESVKIFDFGAAHLNNSKEGMAGEKVIKEGYSAPEQYRDNAGQGFFTDIYSVGAILYQMLTGIKPIESTEREFKDKLKSPLELGVMISGNVDRAVMEAMAVKPELRFQGIEQFEDALNNKRMAEYPKQKLKRRKRMRNWIIATAVSLVLAVGVAIGLYSTVLKPTNPILESLPKQGTKFTVWVENEDQKKWLEEIKEDGFRNNGTPASDEKIRTMQKNNKMVDYEVEVKDNMETSLKDVKGTDAMPNMFISDHVSELGDYNLVSLKDTVYKALDINLYYYMSEYEKIYPQMTEMPTGLNTLLLYHADIGYNSNNTLMREDDIDDKNGIKKKVNKEGGVIIELSKLIKQKGEKSVKKADSKNYLNPSYAVFEENTSSHVSAMILQDSSWLKVLERKETPSTEMRENLMGILEFNSESYQDKYRLNQIGESDIYGNNIVADVTYRKKIGEIIPKGKEEREKKEKEKNINPSSIYDTRIVTCNDKMEVIFSECFAITRESSMDQQKACENLLWVMLTKSGQQKKARSTGAMTYPIFKESLSEFTSYNPLFEDFKELVDDRKRCVLLGRVAGKIRFFASGLEGIRNDNNLQKYCNNYCEYVE